MLAGVGAVAVGTDGPGHLGMRDAGEAVVPGSRQAGPGADGANRSRSRVVVTQLLAYGVLTWHAGTGARLIR